MVGDPFDGTAIALMLYEDPILHGNHDATLRRWQREVVVCRTSAQPSEFATLAHQLELSRAGQDPLKALGFIKLPRFHETNLPLVPTLLKIVSK